MIRGMLATLSCLVLLAGCAGGGGGSSPPPADTTAPSVPQGLTATVISSTRIDLSWTASTDTGGAGLAGYRVFRGGTQLATVNAPATTYSDTTVVASTSYTYSVRAYDAANPANVSAESAAAAAITPPVADTTAPSVPQGLTATAISPTRIDLSWTASTDTGGAGLAGYRVFRGGTQLATVIAPATTYSDTSVIASTSYTYAVRAYDAANPANVSADSAAAAATTPATSPVSGLDSRPSNTTCIAPARPTAPASIQLSDPYPILTFGYPVALLQAPADASRWFVVQQGGVVRVFNNTPGVATSSTFVDITARVQSGGEMGLLGMAFHPNWPTTPEVFLSYTRPSPRRQNVVSRFTSSDSGATLDPASEQVLLVVEQTFSNHNGGNIAFGPDGYLYIGRGDGGYIGDLDNNSQNLQTLLGKMLRIDVRGSGATYAIPNDNPYFGNARCTAGTGSTQCPEIWAFGFRNPWRWSFDRATGDLWVGDVGQDAWEEVDRVVKGGNYGWRQREGAHCYNPSNGCATPGSMLNGGIVVDPVTEYAHDATGGESITGGYVYRGAAIAGLVGQYIFADYVSGRLWAHTPGAGGMQKAELLDTAMLISSFGEGVDGELYALSYTGGKIYKLLPGGSGGTDTIPTSLKQTGCVDTTDPTRPASGLIPFQPNAPFWSDGAAKERFMALPDGSALSANASGDWDFPTGTVLVKNFRLNNKLIETRLFMRHPDGEWGGYSYEWNDAENDATRVVGGKTKLISGQTWVYPSDQQCLHCHTEAAGRSLGLETAQQNGNLTYPQTGRTANQVTTLNTIGVINPAIPGTPATLPAYRNPYGTAGTVGERARAYLHSNCSQCHRPGGPTPTNLDFRYTTALSATNACDVLPSQGDLGVADARLIAPGSPGRSLVVKRVQSLDPAQRMPPLGSTVQDTVAIQLLSDWITQLPNCN